MVHNLSTLFFLYKSKTNGKGTAPIFCRLTHGGKRKQFSTGLYVKDQSWSSQSQKIKGNSEEATLVNNRLDLIRQKLNKSYEQLFKDREEFTVDELYNRYTGSDKEVKTLLEAFAYHNKRMQALIGKDYVRATYDKFVVIQKHIECFIHHQYKTNDYPLSRLKPTFLTDLDHYLKVEKGHNQNTINKLIERLKKVVKIAVGNRWLISDPFLLHQKKKYTKEVVFLNTAELAKLESHKFSQERLSVVRDCFVFSCYTGLAYNEAALLSTEHLELDKDNTLWIDMMRQKTQRPITIPMLPKAINLINKYGYPERKGLLLPVISNQKMNSYLKEVAEIVGIGKNLTHHIARKTFASTVLLNNDVPIEIVSFLLGHSKTTTTEQHYAKIVKESVIRHMNKLR